MSTKELLQPTIDDYGGAPFAEHNMPCAVCRKKPAVLNLNIGVFEPCWSCQGRGWTTYKRESLWKRFKRWFHS